ncbi:MAG: trypsin-like peptidase domain-containing protein [Oligoflexia bacterium]|nr:trypsin-like peptidase domain-containing protein [Oligoflexia bacterium]
MKNLKLITLFLLLSLTACQKEIHFTSHLDKKTLKNVYSGIVEVVVPKIESDFVIYERKLPFDKLPYKMRTDKFHSIGTAFFSDNKKLLSAAHVFALEEYSQWNDFHIRTPEGEVHKIKNIYRYSSYHDVIEFDLETYPKKFKPLIKSEKVEIGDMVYAVGNAQGEGISTRGGQVANFTYEHFNGEWKFIRFSSPASPGNSGGPLVNSKGQVVGIVVLKNQSENLNYALPIGEIKNVSQKEAFFFERNMRVQDGLLAITEDWSFKTPLPSNIVKLREASNPEKDKFYFTLLDQFKTTFRKKSFPYNSKYRESLRFQSLPTNFAYIKKSHNLSKWQLQGINMNRLPVGPGQMIYHGKAEIFPHFIILEKPEEMKLKDFYVRPELTIEAVLSSLGAHRNIAGEQIPILSYGKPHKTKNWTDQLGRNWTTSYWYISYDNSITTTTCTPHPVGVACILNFMFSGQLNEGFHAFMEENIKELVLSYYGSLAQWKEFLDLPMTSTSTLFENMKYVEGKANYLIKNDDVSFRLPKKYYNKNSKVSLQVGYSPSSVLGLKILRWQALIDKYEDTGHSINWFFEPSDDSSDIHQNRWRELLNREKFFSGKVNLENNIYSSRSEVFKVKNYSLILNDEQQSKISAVRYLKCFAENNRSKKWTSTFCKKVRTLY